MRNNILGTPQYPAALSSSSKNTRKIPVFVLKTIDPVPRVNFSDLKKSRKVEKHQHSPDLKLTFKRTRTSLYPFF